MSIKRSTYVMTGDSYFEPGVPIYVNRAYESFDMNEHSHEFVEITYVSEGAGVHYIAGETVPVEHGTLFFIPVGQSHVFRPTTPKKDRPLIVYNCLLPAAYFSELRNSFPHASVIYDGFDEGSWFSMKDTTGEYHAMFRELYQEFSAKPPGYFVILASLVMRILTGMYRHRLQIAAPAGDRPQWLTVDEAIAYIDCNYAAELKLGELATQARLSERQFSRLFRRQTGMSFIEYVQSIRMDAACRLLISSHSSVEDIAGAVGYADLKFFYRLFKKKTGVTPRLYREAMRN
ncbi:AraC-like ligand binding domain-containing protein [Paenibacillus catalpae]|uniref:AraC-like ligand binding domain-containing protein n=1 Tax=Paenibacillus catalpae TaxID=1045775 RepID=A0A1I1VCN4_9BACL|nr:AraC family transcriptional regulator [Paenibacillus catalpae]SFD80851.1 AraC-like ligand binding domain-containing protein [Paenibacillus catalpae]